MQSALEKAIEHEDNLAALESRDFESLMLQMFEDLNETHKKDFTE